MDVKNPKRIMIVGTRDAGILDVVKGSCPAPHESGSIAGLMHELSLRTAYYTAKIPIWIDELEDPDAWVSEFLKPMAREVVEAVGAWIVCFQPHDIDAPVGEQAQKALKSVQAVVEKHNQDFEGEAVLLAVAVPAEKQPITHNDAITSQEQGEDKCMEFGFEYIDYSATGKNEFGERVGIERLREALEATVWDGRGDTEDEIDLEDLDFTEEHDVDESTWDEAEMAAEIFGMKAALNGDDDFNIDAEDVASPSQQAAQVDELEKLMSKLLVIKEQGAELPLAQRKKMAAKAITELMKANK